MNKSKVLIAAIQGLVAGQFEPYCLQDFPHGGEVTPEYPMGICSQICEDYNCKDRCNEKQILFAGRPIELQWIEQELKSDMIGCFLTPNWQDCKTIEAMFFEQVCSAGGTRECTEDIVWEINDAYDSHKVFYENKYKFLWQYEWNHDYEIHPCI